MNVAAKKSSELRVMHRCPSKRQWREASTSVDKSSARYLIPFGTQPIAVIEAPLLLVMEGHASRHCLA